MRILRFIALIGAAACATVHVWTLTKSWDVEKASLAFAVLAPAVFVVGWPAAMRAKRLELGPLSTSVRQASPLLTIVPHLFLYAIFNALVWVVLIKAGDVHARHGHYFQNPWWGHVRDTEWEIPFATYKRFKGFEVRAQMAFLFVFYFLAFAIFSLGETPSTPPQGDSAAA